MAKRVDHGVVLAAIKAGMNDHEIADLLHVSRTTVLTIRQRAGIPASRARRAAKRGAEGGIDTQKEIDMCLACKKENCTGNIRQCKAEIEEGRRP